MPLDKLALVTLSCTQMYRLNKPKLDKKSVLLKQSQKLFHTNDLALLWGITSKNTLYTAIKRYKKDGTLIPIHKGFYSVMPLSQLDPTALGAAFLHRYAYLSTESVLAREGVIAQTIPALTFVSNITKTFKLGETDYTVRQMANQYLYNTGGVIKKDHHYEATLERAVADLLYYNPTYHFDNKELINWDRVKEIQKEVGFK